MDNTVLYHSEHYGKADRTYELWTNGINAVHMLRKDSDVTVFPSLQDLVMYEQGADVESFRTTEAVLLDLEGMVEDDQLYVYEHLKNRVQCNRFRLLPSETISIVDFDMGTVCSWINQPEYWLKSHLHHRLTYVDVVGANEHLYSLSSDQDEDDLHFTEVNSDVTKLIQMIREQAPDAAYFRLTS